ncbi:MAG TPA: cation diffusion facilitator family transporter [Prolixibacteraceae bacterium]|nr:cation transporter [Bacteroidales bacterium]HPJ77279.1 cation diffusion facilitator family transporter [Prolixibacteraceae bacterium]HRV89101.1 cation diffusion facilitator family transporter [Prolixibacteraceae bacterium]
MSGHTHTHGHDHRSGHTRNRLALTVVLNSAITVAQVIGGIISGSLALISDALHNLSDVLAVVLAWVAHYLSGKPRTGRSSFGLQRAEILAAFINALVLMGISVFLVVEAIRRFMHPGEVDPVWMFWLGLLGIVANGISVLILHGGRNHNLNMKAAYLHLLGDTLTSVAVVAGALCIHFLGWYWIDPVVTLLISAYLAVHTWSILRESVEILMQMSPAHLDPDKVSRAVASVEGVRSVHHIHIWKLNDERIHFEAHVVLPADSLVSETASIHKKIKEMLKAGFGINHVTIQFEYKNKTEADCDC